MCLPLHFIQLEAAYWTVFRQAGLPQSGLFATFCSNCTCGHSSIAPTAGGASSLQSDSAFRLQCGRCLGPAAEGSRWPRGFGRVELETGSGSAYSASCAALEAQPGGWAFLAGLTSKCASPRNRVHFFDIINSKSAPRRTIFDTFDFKMCFAPKRRTLFQHLNFQKCSEQMVI